jgi:hypothetical protein
MGGKNKKADKGRLLKHITFFGSPATISASNTTTALGL